MLRLFTSDYWRKLRILTDSSVSILQSAYFAVLKAKSLICKRSLPENVLKTISHLGHLKNIIRLSPSGQREQPLFVEEPYFIVIRKESKAPETSPDIMNDLFIPPRGRKQFTQLQNYFQEEEIFLPNRGKKDKLSDIFKYDETFFPNRGKKHM